MKLRTKKVRAGDCNMEEIKELYEEAFPKNERIDWESLARERADADFCAYYDQDTFVGLTYCYRQGHTVWWFYFAVRKELRDKGYGTEILEYIKATYKDDLLMMDIEDPEDPKATNKEQRQKRYDFYRRMGFESTPAKKSWDDVTMIILSRGGTVSQEHYEEMIGKMRKEYM